MNSRTLRALAVAGLAACASPALGVITLSNGQSVGLGAILDSNDRQVIIGDKLFTFVTWTSVAFPPPTVSISAFIATNPLQGTGFDITGGFGDVNPGDMTISEFNLRYTVEILPSFIAQGYRIVDSELAFNGAAAGVGSYARVDESILDYNGVPGQNLVTTASTFAFGSGSPTAQLQDRHVFGPPGYTKLEINKDVQFFANGANGSSSASFVRQSFSQIPAPGAMALLGLAGLVAARRRR